MSDVKVSVTFRHTDPTGALKRYAEDKVQRIRKYFSRPVEAHVVLSVDSRERQIAEVSFHIQGTTIHCKEETIDLYSAIDLVMDKIERQIQKHKEKSKLEKRRKAQD
jgi:putative sigma-54 modulation protein